MPCDVSRGEKGQLSTSDFTGRRALGLHLGALPSSPGPQAGKPVPTGVVMITAPVSLGDSVPRPGSDLGGHSSPPTRVLKERALPGPHCAWPRGPGRGHLALLTQVPGDRSPADHAPPAGGLRTRQGHGRFMVPTWLPAALRPPSESVGDSSAPGVFTLRGPAARSQAISSGRRLATQTSKNYSPRRSYT